ncbi:hypothetical protein PJ267_03180 [Arthrobacter sp. OVS8]|nr:hypothetical protein PJ267_03180 [Arthrobacter sp. OVS8]
MSRHDVRLRAHELSTVSPAVPLEAKALAKAGIAGWAARLGTPASRLRAPAAGHMWVLSPPSRH